MTSITTAIEGLTIAERGHVIKRLSEMYISAKPSKAARKGFIQKEKKTQPKPEKWRTLWEATEVHRKWRELIKPASVREQQSAEDRKVHDVAYAEAQTAAMAEKDRLKLEYPPTPRPQGAPKGAKGKGRLDGVTEGERPAPTANKSGLGLTPSEEAAEAARNAKRAKNGDQGDPPEDDAASAADQDPANAE
jgi:hypothetical protein